MHSFQNNHVSANLFKQITKNYNRANRNNNTLYIVKCKAVGNDDIVNSKAVNKDDVINCKPVNKDDVVNSKSC